MDLDLEHLEGYTTDELEAGLHEMDELKQRIRGQMRGVVQALSERHAVEVAKARVEAMGDDERTHLTMALQGIEPAEVGALDQIAGGA